MEVKRRKIDMKGKITLLYICIGLTLFVSNASLVLATGPDINNDGKVDIKDIAIVARAFGSYPGHPRWNPDADLYQDLQIDIRDIAIVASCFGT
jgi:hypothetical protein